MKTIKNIDHLYHERLKDLETTPREELWRNISASLPEKRKKKRIFPFWFRIAGTAAIIILLFSVGITFLNPSKNVDNYPSNSFTSVPSEIKEKLIKLNSLSTDFDYNMHHTSILLQTLIKDTQSEKLEFEENRTHSKTENTSLPNNILFADIIKPPSEVKLNGSKYTFDDYNTVAFAQEERKKEIIEKDTSGKELEDLAHLTSKDVNEELMEEGNQLSLTSKRISVRTTAGAVYFDKLGTGNTINSQFGTKKSGGEISIAYGINFAYQISEKVKIRSGINKVELSHNTQDVDYAAAASMVAVKSYNPRQLNGETTPLISSRISGELNQQMGFIEVPVEIEYALFDKKIGIYLIGGASTLFLNTNMVTLKFQESTNRLGKAQNLNNISFSTNLGMGIDYNLSSSFQWNLEPIFKYQLNTFSNNSGVKPYNFGIYSGFSFKF